MIVFLLFEKKREAGFLLPPFVSQCLDAKVNIIPKVVALSAQLVVTRLKLHYLKSVFLFSNLFGCQLSKV